MATTWIGCVPGEIDGGAELVGHAVGDIMHVSRPPGEGSVAEQSLALTAGAPRTVFLNKSGGTYTAGWDDSARGVSSIVQGQGYSSVTMPASTMTADQWSRFVACVRDEYARFNVTIVDQRPSAGAGPYIEAVIGGTGRELGYGDGIGGVAPVDSYRCTPMGGAVVFIFAGNWFGRDPIVTCEIAAHEIGHSIVPLDHEYLAPDPMTYLSYSGHKVFQDQAAQCGEYSPKACFCNRATQNTVQLLYGALGAKPSTPPTPSEPPAPSMPPADVTPPLVEIVEPADGATLAANSSITIKARATDAGGVASLSLYWQFTGNTLPCDSTSFQGVSCSLSNGVATWSLAVGSGERSFYAIAKDKAGNQARSASRTIHLGAATPPPAPVAAPPSVTVISPAAGTVLSPGAPLHFQARVGASSAIVSVTANWTNPYGQTSQFAMREESSGVWGLSTNLSTSAMPGQRTLSVSATDDRGQKTTSSSVLLTVR